MRSVTTAGRCDTRGTSLEADETICFWCGKTLDLHEDARPPGAPQPRVPCLRLKAGFLPEAVRLLDCLPARSVLIDADEDLPVVGLALGLAAAARAVLQGKARQVDSAGDRYVIDRTLQELQAALDRYDEQMTPRHT